MHRFKIVNYIQPPILKELVCFSCDNEYFLKYAIYNIQSCLKNHQAVHCHVINPSVESEKIIKNLNSEIVSFSIEFIDFQNCNLYQIKTYYYCCRFYIAEDLFEKFDISSLWITDADVIFNEKIDPLVDKKLGVFYNPDGFDLWRKTTANLFFVHKDEKKFLSRVIEEYESRYNCIDFDKIDQTMSKHERANLVGLDQVSMSAVIEKFYLNDINFCILDSTSNLKGKHRAGVKVWIPVGKSKSEFIIDGFKKLII